MQILFVKEDRIERINKLCRIWLTWKRLHKRNIFFGTKYLYNYLDFAVKIWSDS